MNEEGKAQADIKHNPGQAEAVANAPSSDSPPRHSDIEMHKKKTLVLSVPDRLEGLSAVIVVIAALVFLFMSGHTLYQFPVPDSYRWYGDETWLMMQWKSLVTHGQMIVPIALESTLLKAPGLLLGSSWFMGIVYGIPQLLLPPHFDPVTIGRTISFLVGLLTLSVIGWAAYRLKLSSGVATLVITILLATRSFTFATHSARYDMMTGFAVLAFVAFFTIRVGKTFWERSRRGPFFAFWLGLVAMLLGFTISPHVAAILILPTIFIAWYFRCFESIAHVVMLLVGAAIGLVFLAVLYIVANHELIISGIAAGDNEANAYLQHLPIVKLFSWSAQSHQLGSKLYYLWQEAPAFAIALPLIAASEILLLVKKQPHAASLFLTFCLFLVLVSGAFLQSTLPYYLMHVMPLVALAFAAHLHEWMKWSLVKPIVAIASLVVAVEIFGLWLPELSNAGRMGKRIGEANTAAIQAAIEFESRNRVEESGKPLILAQAPALHELLRDTSLRVMTEGFLFFPLHSEPDDSIIRHAGVDYILDYDKPMTRSYAQLVREWKPIFTRSGPLLDRTLNYFHDTTSELDTLTFYERDTTP